MNGFRAELSRAKALPVMSNNCNYIQVILENPPVELYYASAFDCSELRFEELSSFLSSEELNSIRITRDYNQRILRVLSRGLLRELLAEKTGQKPEDLIFERTTYGKPVLSSVISNAPHFNISHSQEWVLIALSASHEVGVDLERINPTLLTDQLIEDVTTEEERREMAALDLKARSERFFQLWVGKESLLKVTGVGLSGLGGLLADNCEQKRSYGANCKTVHLSAPVGYVAALSFRPAC